MFEEPKVQAEQNETLKAQPTLSKEEATEYLNEKATLYTYKHEDGACDHYIVTDSGRVGAAFDNAWVRYDKMTDAQKALLHPDVELKAKEKNPHFPDRWIQTTSKFNGEDGWVLKLSRTSFYLVTTSGVVAKYDPTAEDYIEQATTEEAPPEVLRFKAQQEARSNLTKLKEEIGEEERDAEKIEIPPREAEAALLKRIGEEIRKFRDIRWAYYIPLTEKSELNKSVNEPTEEYLKKLGDNLVLLETAREIYIRTLEALQEIDSSEDLHEVFEARKTKGNLNYYATVLYNEVAENPSSAGVSYYGEYIEKTRSEAGSVLERMKQEGEPADAFIARELPKAKTRMLEYEEALKDTQNATKEELTSMAKEIGILSVSLESAWLNGSVSAVNEIPFLLLRIDSAQKILKEKNIESERNDHDATLMAPHLRSSFSLEEREQQITRKLQTLTNAVLPKPPFTKASLEKALETVKTLKSLLPESDIPVRRDRNRENDSDLNALSHAKYDLEYSVKEYDNYPAMCDDLYRLAESAKKEIMSSLGTEASLYEISSHFPRPSTSPDIYICIDRKDDGPRYKIALHLKQEKDTLQIARPAEGWYEAGKTTKDKANESTIRNFIRKRMNAAPSALLLQGPKIGIPTTDIRLHALTVGKPYLEYFSYIAESTYAQKFQKASKLLTRINGQVNLPQKLSFTPFNHDSQWLLERLMTLSEQKYADHILAALKDGSQNVGYPYTDPTRHRHYFDAEKDHGILMQVNQRIIKRVQKGDFKDWPAMQTYIREEWANVRKKQWESFAKSEEFAEQEPKEVHVLSIATKEFSKAEDDLAKEINAHLHHEKNQAPEGGNHKIISDDFRSSHDFYQAIRGKLEILQKTGAHVVVVLHAHGYESTHEAAGKMAYTFPTDKKDDKGNVIKRDEWIDSSEILKLIDASGVSSTKYVSTCHGGSHLKMQKNLGKYTAKNTTTFGNNTVVGGGLGWRLLSGAYKNDANNVFCPGDINEDGIVTQAEIREYINLSGGTVYGSAQDPIIYDEEGNQIGAFVPEREDRYA